MKSRSLPVLREPVEVDAITDGDDRFRCHVFSAVLTARACLQRRGARVEVARTIRGESATHRTHERCVRCEVGARVESRVTAAPVEPTRAGAAPWLYRRKGAVIGDGPEPRRSALTPSSPEVRDAILRALVGGPRRTSEALAEAASLSSESTARRALTALTDAGRVVPSSYGCVALASRSP